MSRFFKTGKFKISQNTIDTANKFYDLGYSIDLNEEVYDLIFDFITFFKPRNVLDPHCGVGNVLNSIKNTNKVGYEKNQKALEIAKEININSSFKLVDIYKENISEKFDAIASVMPFFGKYSDHINNIFYLIEQNLNDNGNLILILPDGFFFGQNKQLKDGRNKLIKSWNVTHIIDLPTSYNTGVKLKMLVVNKSPYKLDNSVYMPRVTDFNRLAVNKKLQKQNIIENTISKTGRFWVKKEDLILSSTWERRFHDPVIRSIEQDLVNNNAKKLSEVADLILAGKYVKNDLRKQDDEILVITPNNIKNNNFTLSSKDYFISSNEITNYQKLTVLKGDIILNSIGPNFKFCIIPKNIKGIINQNIFLIRSENNDFIIKYLLSNTGREEFLKQTKKHSRGIIIPKLYLSGLKNILVPILPNTKKTSNSREIDDYIIPSNALKILSNEFSVRGWDVKLEDKVGKSRLDIGLHYNNKLVSFVEIKKNRDKINNIDLEKQVKVQADTILEINDLNGCFIIINFDIYSYNKNNLEKLNSFPNFSDYKKILINEENLISEVSKQRYKGRQQKDGNTNSHYKQILEENDYERLELKDRFIIELVKKEMLELVKKQSELAEKQSKDYKELKTGMQELIEGQKNIKSDTKLIPELAKKLDIMMSEISEIKSLTKDTNESIEKSISKIISSVEKNHDFNTIEDYIPKVTEWFKFWDKIEENTKTFMPGSEWLYDNIKSSDFQDFSPFVLYYCRALENELLKKIFLTFHDHVNEMNDDELKSLFVWNKEGLNEKKLKEYDFFYKTFKTNIENNRDNYNLGFIRETLSILPSIKKPKGSERFKRSPLIIEFNNFLSLKMRRIENDTLERLRCIIKDYRNKSAHVGIIDDNQALHFYNEFKLLMNKIIEKF